MQKYKTSPIPLIFDKYFFTVHPTSWCFSLFNEYWWFPNRVLQIMKSTILKNFVTSKVIYFGHFFVDLLLKHRMVSVLRLNFAFGKKDWEYWWEDQLRKGLKILIFTVIFKGFAINPTNNCSVWMFLCFLKLFISR